MRHFSGLLDYEWERKPNGSSAAVAPRFIANSKSFRFFITAKTAKHPARARKRCADRSAAALVAALSAG